MRALVGVRGRRYSGRTMPSTPTGTPSFTIDEVTIPASIDAADAADFIEATGVVSRVEADIVGSFDLAYTPAELLPTWHDPYEPRRMFVARVDGRIVGRAVHEVQSGDAVPSAWITVDVLPEVRGRGIGGALYDTAAAIAVNEGRTVLQVFAMHRDIAGGERITSPTGYGSVSRHDPGARFLLARGYRLAQVDRMSRLPLPASPPVVEQPAGYSLEVWEGPTPEHRLADLAILHAAMSTEPPLGETDYQPEVWDEARVRDVDTRGDAEGRRWLTAVVRHDATDSLVGFTQLTVPADLSRPVFQQDTVVLEAHRGHRLGMVVKAANLARLEELAPGHPSVYTWNAEENRHMLAVNEALGFVAAGYPGSWRLDL